MVRKFFFSVAEVNPKWFFTVRNSRCDIIVESSERITHNITSNIFKILLDEVMGYDSVKIVQRHDYFNSSRALDWLLYNRPSIDDLEDA